MRASPIAVPAYLIHTHWWAYVHPRAVRLFERQWLVNLILWGNFNRLRDAALDALGPQLSGRALQVACVYGDLTSRLAARLAPDGRLDVVGVLRTLEPFAMDLWRHEIAEWFPANARIADVRKETSFGGLYQRVTITL